VPGPSQVINDFAERLRLIEDTGLTGRHMYPIALLGHRLCGPNYLSQRYPH